MILMYIILVILVATGLRFDKLGDKDPCAISHATALKGIFIFLVIVRHLQGFVSRSGYEYSGLFDRLFVLLGTLLGQLIVVMFLFYSGYGVTCSFVKKGEKYIQEFPKKRILTTWLNYAIAVCVYAAVLFAMGEMSNVSICRFLTTLVCWDKIGNPSWYIFVILVCYGSSYLAARLRNCFRWPMSLFVTSLLAVVWIALLSVGKEPWWYNTIIAYALGCWYAEKESQLQGLLEKNAGLCICVSCCGLLALTICPWGGFGIKDNLLATAFAVLVITSSFYVSVESRVLSWLGEKLFPLYIYHCLVAMVGAHYFGRLIQCHPLLFMISVFGLTTCVAACYKLWRIKL